MASIEINTYYDCTGGSAAAASAVYLITSLAPNIFSFTLCEFSVFVFGFDFRALAFLSLRKSVV